MRDFTRLTIFLLTLFASASMLIAQSAPAGVQTKAEFLGLETASPEYPAFNVNQTSSREVLLEEGFDFAFPPTGWTIEETHPTNNWNQTNPDNSALNFNNVDPNSLFSAMAMWHASIPSNEWMITPAINANEMPVNLEFYYGISGAWLTGATLKIHVSTDGGDSWTELMNVIDEVDPAAAWQWYNVMMDVSAYADGPFHIAWQYIGVDGDLCGVDGVRISSGGDFLYVDDFESYDLGAGIAASSDWWILWPASGVTDVLVSNEQSNSPTQSLKVGTGPIDDVVLLLGNKTSGVYGLDFYIYVPDGAFSGYYNLQHFEAPGVEWACQVWFASNGDGWVDAGVANAAVFTYEKASWVHIQHTIDLDEDWIELWVNGSLVYGWPFSWQANSQSGTKMLGGLNLYPAPQAGTTSLYYIDDVSYYVLTPGSLDPSIDISTSQIITTLQEGNTQTVNRTITNVGESVLVYDIVTTFNEPTMRSLPDHAPAGSDVKNISNEVALAPNAEPGEPFPAQRNVTLNYDGENNSGIGLTNGGQWRVAARFPASMVGQYNGMYLEQVMVYVREMAAEFKVQVYGMGSLMIPGAGPLLAEQTFTAVPMAWNTITLDEPVYIDGSDIWIGYYIDQQIPGTFPAGVDNGPPVPDGRWISTGVGWGYLSETLPYNWNVRGMLTGEAGTVWLSTSPTEGALEAQESDNIAISINASNLPPLNVYRGRLHVRSNDPVNAHLTINVVLSVLVGLNEIGEKAYVSSFPNPTSDLLNVKANTDILRLSVSNLLGQIVYQAEVNKAETMINMSGYDSGIYFVKIETTNGTATHKVMVR